MQLQGVQGTLLAWNTTALCDKARQLNGCFACVCASGRLLSGTVEGQADQLVQLEPEQIKAGYIMLCSSFPTSDCTS